MLWVYDEEEYEAQRKVSSKFKIFITILRGGNSKYSDCGVKSRIAVENTEDSYIFTLLPTRKPPKPEKGFGLSSFSGQFLMEKSSSYILLSGENSGDLKQWIVPLKTVDTFLHTKNKEGNLKYFIDTSIISTDYYSKIPN